MRKVVELKVTAFHNQQSLSDDVSVSVNIENVKQGFFHSTIINKKIITPLFTVVVIIRMWSVVYMVCLQE